MKVTNIIVISVAANVALGAWIVHAWRKPVAIDTAVVQQTNVTRVVVERPMETEPASTAIVTNRFQWKAVESEDLKLYVANLRKIGCPEKTIRDIILAEVDYIYGKKRSAAREERDFWINGRAKMASDIGLERKWIELNNEEEALVKELLGIDWVRPSGGLSRSREEGVEMFLVTETITLPVALQVKAIQEKYDRMGRQVRHEARGILLPEDRVKLKEIQARMEAETAKLMSQHEYEEFRLRMKAISQITEFAELSEAGVVLTGDEARKMAQFQPDGAVSWFGRDRDNDEDVDRQVAYARNLHEEKEKQEKIKALLGEKRYENYQVATDDYLQWGMKFEKEQSLPPATGRALYDIYQAAQLSVADIRADQSLTSAERRKALRDIRATTEGALGQLMDAKVHAEFNKSGSSWLNKISSR